MSTIVETPIAQEIVHQPEVTKPVVASNEFEDALTKHYSKGKAPVEVVKAGDKAPEKPDTKAQQPVKPPGDVPSLRKEYDTAIGELKETRGKLKEFQDKLADFEGTVKERDTLKASIEELQKQVEAAKKIEGVAALEMSPEFQKKYVTGLNEKIGKLKELASYADLNPDDISAALGKTGKERFQALQNALDSAPLILQGKIIAAIEEIEGLSAEKYAELEGADERLKARMSEQEAKARESKDARTKSINEAWSSTSAELAKEYSLDAAALETAEKFFKSNNDPRKRAEVVIKGHAADVLRTRVSELEAEITRLTGAAPGLEAGGDKKGGTKLGFREQMVADFKASR